MIRNTWLRSQSTARHRGRGRPRAGGRRLQPRLEACEDRTLLSTFLVKNLNDSGPDSLRAAILATDANPGADLIKFAGGLKGTITLASELDITDDLTIDGPGAQGVTVSGNDAT